ncbi:hypothetical protein [Arcobacter sp. LA11]|uniref:hypothetical protein n=1 Tax=Arcobacter sp. LA11 TaxID=1898176 RepID=UPI00093515AD|nr:hypothetical protein [Arcobacter sp. LA11]
MGLFDVGIRKEISSQKNKEEVLQSIKNSIEEYSQETSNIENGTIILNNFKYSILKYNLSINLNKSNKDFDLSIDGELQQFYVLILVALIILSILFTFGIGVIFVVAFAYLQKSSTSKVLNSFIQKI